MTTFKRTLMALMMIAMVSSFFGKTSQAAFIVGETYTTGAGVQLGDPLGVVADYWVPNTNYAVHGGFGLDWRTSAAAFWVDGRYLFKDMVDAAWIKPKAKITLYPGLGYKIAFENGGTHTLRLPLGGILRMDNSQFSFYAELVPVINLGARVSGGLDGAGGVTYYFR